MMKGEFYEMISAVEKDIESLELKVAALVNGGGKRAGSVRTLVCEDGTVVYIQEVVREITGAEGTRNDDDHYPAIPRVSLSRSVTIAIEYLVDSVEKDHGTVSGKTVLYWRLRWAVEEMAKEGYRREQPADVPPVEEEGSHQRQS